jgi:hypothetical protein
LEIGIGTSVMPPLHRFAIYALLIVVQNACGSIIDVAEFDLLSATVLLVLSAAFVRSSKPEMALCESPLSRFVIKHNENAAYNFHDKRTLFSAAK